MHVALVISTLRGGGAERTVLDLAAGLIHRGHSVDIVLFRNRIHFPTGIPEDAHLYVVDDRPDKRTEKYAPEILKSFVQIDTQSRPFDWFHAARALNWNPLCLPDARLLRYTRALARYMELSKPDCVLPSLPRAKTATLLASRLLNEPPPIVPILHSVVRYRRSRYRRRYRHLFKEAAHFVGVSRGVSQDLSETIGIPNERITTIYNPVTTPDLHKKMAQRPDHPWLLDGGPPVILSAGRLEREKDYPTLIRAFGRLASQRECRLIIVGDGKLKHNLEHLAAKLGLSSRVCLPGWVDNPYAFMAQASCFVLSSRYEGLGLALIEALASGCPCVSTNCPTGPAEILQDGRFGRLVPVGDEAALAEAMDQTLRQGFDRRILQRRAEDFSAERSVAAYERLLRALVP